MDKKMMGWTAVVVGVLIALNTALTWPAGLNYLWAVLVALWGLMSLR